jgi:hypothetical protein
MFPILILSIPNDHDHVIRTIIHRMSDKIAKI